MSGDAPHPRAQLARWGLRPKKKYGQNFLVEGQAAQRIARLSLSACESGARTLEIGAGTGALSKALVDEGAALTVLEIDPELVAVLRARDDLAAAQIVRADALEFDYAAWAGDAPWCVAGNLPYNIATPLIVRLVEMEGGPQSLCVMVQKDVADRLVAKPGTKAYGSLSLAVQYAMEVERAFTLGPHSFYPPPKVQSTVVLLTRRPHPAVHPRDLELFRKVVRAGFAYRRKTLANSLHLALGLERATVERALANCNLSAELRGERLSLDDFARVADELAY